MPQNQQAHTAEPVRIFASAQTYQDIAAIAPHIYDVEVTAESLRADIESLTGDNQDDYKLASQLSFALEDTIKMMPSRWPRLFEKANQLLIEKDLAQLNRYVSYLDIMLHNNEIQKPNVRQKIKVRLTPHDVNTLLTTAKADALHEGTSYPKVWKCLQTLCALHFKDAGSLPAGTTDKIMAAANHPSSLDAEHAATTLRSFTHLHAATFAKQTIELV